MFKLIIITSFLLCSVAFSQQSMDGWKVFDETQVAQVEITVSPQYLAFIYANPHSDSQAVARVHFKNAQIDEIIDSVGFGLRGNTSRDAQKKSFKLEFNAIKKGERFHSLKDLNLNGEHNDVSIIRSKLSWDIFAKAGLTGSRASHAEVYINGQYFGLYISVENVDDEFIHKRFISDTGNLWKCLYPADLRWLGSNPSSYINLLNNGVPAYKLMTNETKNDFNALIRLINVVNNVSDAALPDSIESIIDVPDFLKYLALHVSVGSWDNYWSLMNNYYLYLEPGREIFHLLPYDEDNAYSIDWFNVTWATANIYSWPKSVSGNRPLADRLIANTQYHNLYTHYMEFIRDNIFALPKWETRIDSLKAKILPSVSNDTFRTKDYGFTITQFNNSFSATSFSNQHVKMGIKQYINARNAATTSQAQYVFANPIAYKIDYYPQHPEPSDSIYVVVSAFDNSGLSEVSIKFTPAGQSVPVTYPMKFAPVAGTLKIEESDRYLGVLPPLGANGSGKFSIYLRDNTLQTQTYPRRAPIVITSAPLPTVNLLINEFLADNTTYPDTMGEFDDYVEIYNPTAQPVLLTGRYLSDSPGQLTKYRFTQPNFLIPPHGYVLVWCDEQGTQPGIHANFKLSKSGEFIALTDTNGISIIDSLSFGAQTTNVSCGRFPDGNSAWGFMHPTPGASNMATGIDANDMNRLNFELAQNYPNPFNPSTTFTYSIPSAAKVNLIIYDIMGRQVRVLVNEEKAAGVYSVVFNAEDIPSGVYCAVCSIEGSRKTVKALLLK